MSSGRKKNKELASDNSPEEKRRRHQGTSDTDVASTSKKHPKPKISDKLKELIAEKSVKTIVEVLKDRIDRKMKNDKMADMESVILVVRTMMANNASHLLPEVLGSLKQIKTQWPVRSDIQTEKQNLQLIKASYKDKVLTEENAKNELYAVGVKIEGLDEQRLKEFSVETLKTKFFSAFPWLRESTEINSHVIPVDQDHRNLPTREKLLSNFSTETNGLASPVDQGNRSFASFEELRSNLCNLISQLYDENNKEVGISDYDGLPTSIEGHWLGETSGLP